MNRPLNFLHLTTFYPPYSFGGDAIALYRLCHALGDAGHTVDVIHCVDSYHALHPSPPPLRFREHPNVIRHELRSGYGGISPVLTQQFGRPMMKSRQIRRVLDSRPYDVIHFHNISLLGPRVMTLEPSQGRPVKMYTTHEHWLICPTHVLWKFNKRPCEKPSCVLCTFLAGRPPQFWRHTNLLEKASEHVDLFVSPSRFTARMHAERGFPRDVRHLPYFIGHCDSDWQKPAARPQARPYFLFAGRLEAIKGLQTVIAAWNRVLDCDLLVAGAGTQEASMRKLASGNPRIRFLGVQSQEQLGPYYHHAVACIVPSLTYETFGMVSIEAFARKTPVIVRNMGALPETVQDSQGGLIYNTTDELLACIHRLASSPEFRADLGENGYRAFLRFWSPEPHLKLYFSLLRDTARRKFGCVPWEMETTTVAST